ncbi:MAG: carboxypeptidase-like regulatory domain-containing protein, partial [Prevotellaceae bacterium]|nr:carboxypeptidase-like regulatory domain-containing protein [Prevotellaceae bacterium]
MKKTTLFLLCLVFAGSSALWAQNVQVSGVVTDAEGQPLPGVSVVVKGARTSTSTDVNGRYTISVPGDATLAFSFVGMKTHEESVGGRAVIDVVLESGTVALDEVVVTALGISREKKALGYAVQEVKADALDKAANTNLVTALQGKISGVDIVSSSGMPGAS